MARRKNKLSLISIIFIILVLLLLRFTEEVDKDVPPNSRFQVIKVIDGDTFILQGGDKVRLLSIDTPEKGEIYYQEAKDYLTERTLGKIVTLAYADKR